MEAIGQQARRGRGRWPLILALWVAASIDWGTPIPMREVAKADPALKNQGGVLLHHGTPFSGFVTERAGGQILSRTPFWQGKEHGHARGWYPDGSKRYERYYQHGYKEGTHHGWWDNGRPQFVYHYRRDLFEGEQMTHFKNGARAEVRHYRRGYEEGQQSLWNGEGRLIANYTFKDGRRYGIVGRFDCVTVHQE